MTIDQSHLIWYSPNHSQDPIRLSSKTTRSTLCRLRLTATRFDKGQPVRRPQDGFARNRPRLRSRRRELHFAADQALYLSDVGFVDSTV